MRSTKRAPIFSVLLISVALSGSSFGENGPTPSPSDFESERSVVQIATDIPLTGGGVVASDSQALQPSNFVTGAVEQGFSPFLPIGPSNVSPLLRYMQCDPHSCPQIWSGYDAQRIADLHRRCNPICGCGHCKGSCGCGGVQHYSNACIPCGHHAPRNRYHNNRCGSGNCGYGVGCDQPAASGCSSCDGVRMDNSLGAKTNSVADVALKDIPGSNLPPSLAR